MAASVRLTRENVQAGADRPGGGARCCVRRTPGLAETLPGFYRLMRPLLRTAAEGADTIVWLATQPEPASTSGRLYLDRRPRPFDRMPATRLSAADRRRLWADVVGLAGGPDPATAE